jgi:hypothetical protein
MSSMLPRLILLLSYIIHITLEHLPVCYLQNEVRPKSQTHKRPLSDTRTPIHVQQTDINSTCFTRSVKHCLCDPCWPVIPPGKGREEAVRWDCSPVYVEREEEAQEAQEDLPMRVWVDVVHLCYQLHAAITASISITRHSGQSDIPKAQL